MLVIIFRDFGPLYVFIRFRDIKKNKVEENLLQGSFIQNPPGM